MQKYDIKPLLKALKGKPNHLNPSGPNLVSSAAVETEQYHAAKWLRSRNYNLYLQSYVWQNKRVKVLERDNYACVLCGNAAEHVHHLTYDRIYDEPLYDLVSLCKRCHKAIHWSKK